MKPKLEEDNTTGFHLHKGLKQAKLSSADRGQDSNQLPLVGEGVQVVPEADPWGTSGSGCQQYSVSWSEH